MIYCVIPAQLEGELFEKLTRYYANDPGVTVIVDRRRARVVGEFPSLAGEGADNPPAAAAPGE
jgi:hypothetical protein